MTRLRTRPSIEHLETRIAPAGVVTAIDMVANSDGVHGFTISGGGGATNVNIAAVTNAGDVNGDGIPDLLVGIPVDGTSKGKVALIFGRATGFPTNIDLDALGTNGVLITGQVNGDQLGYSMAGLGDVNGDGFGDFVIGAPGNDAGGSESGSAYVIFGKGSWNATLGLASLNGSTGFKITGDTRRTGLSGIAQAVGGYNVGSAGVGGDFNGDGFADILIGAQDIRAFAAGGASSGAVFVVYGKQTTGTGGTAYPATLSVGALDGTNGFMLGSTTAGNFIGSEVGFIGDVNQDGFTDISLGNQSNPQLGMRTSYVVFGRATTAANVTLELLAASDGFKGLAAFDVNFRGFQYYGSEYVLRDIDADGDLDLGVSFTTSGFATSEPALQGYTFVKNSGRGYTTNPFGDLGKELRQGLLGYSNAGVDAQLYDLGDFNGDGNYDIAGYPYFFPVTSPFAGVFEGKAPTKTYVANNGDTAIATQFGNIPAASGNAIPDVRFIGDLNGDGVDDVIVLPTPGSGTAAAPNGYVIFGDAFNVSADGKTVTLRDIDGDAVTVKTSAGKFIREMFTFSHPLTAVQNGQQIDRLDLAAGDATSDTAFAGANITVTVKKAATGNGRVDLGVLSASGIDLGNVVIPGGLGAIIAGDGDLAKPALAKLDVDKFGKIGSAAPVTSLLAGRVGTFDVATDFVISQLNVVGPASEGITTFKVGGAFSGAVTVSGWVKSLTTGEFSGNASFIAGGAVTDSTTVKTKLIGDAATVTVTSKVKSLTATQIGTATLAAARFDSISVTGDTRATVPLPGSFAGNLTAANGVGSISIKENFSGKLDLTGSLATLASFKAFDLVAGALINVEGTSTKKTSVTAHLIESGVTVDILNTVSKLSAAQVANATLKANRFDTIAINGDPRAAVPLPGSFAASVEAPLGIGSISIKENFSGKLDLEGSTGTLVSFKAFDLLSGSSINAEGTTTSKTSFSAHVVNDGVLLTIDNTLSKLTAARIGSATITAHRIDTLTVSGDSKAAIPGDLAAEITLTNAGSTGDVKALGKASVSGAVRGAILSVAGSVGSFSAAAMQNAFLYVGYLPTNLAQPLGGGTFTADALLGSFTITGKVALNGAIPSTASMDDSYVVATSLGTINLADLDSTTGATQWGFAYRDTIKSLKAKNPSFAYDVVAAGLQASDDFSVRKL